MNFGTKKDFSINYFKISLISNENPIISSWSWLAPLIFLWTVLFYLTFELRVGLICFVTLDRQWARAHTLLKLNIWDSRLVFKRLITESRKLTESSRMFFVIANIVAHFSYSFLVLLHLPLHNTAFSYHTDPKSKYSLN